MSTPFKRTVARGFTLIELLIVVIIVAILAAIVIPQFSSSTTDAQLAALDSNLSAARTAIEQYRVQHGGVYPGVNTATGGADCVGTAADAAASAGTKEAMVAQLTGYSNDKGQVCSGPNPDKGYKYGPYMRVMPTETVGNLNTVTLFTKTGAPLTADNKGGWAYDDLSGQFIMNNSDLDPNKKAYSTH